MNTLAILPSRAALQGRYVRLRTQQAVVVALALLLPAIAAWAEEIRWRTESPAAFEEAKRLDRPVLIEFTAANCGWCRTQERCTHTDKHVISLLNDQFVPLRQTGGPLVSKYGNLGTPHTVLLTPDGEHVLARLVGYWNPVTYRMRLALSAQRRPVQAAAPEAFDKFLEGEALWSNNKFPEAIKQLNAAMPDLKTFAQLYLVRGLCHYLSGDRASAKTDYDAAISHDPALGYAYFARGVVFFDEAKSIDAEKDFKQALTLDPVSGDKAAVYLALTLAGNGKSKEGELFLRRYRQQYRPATPALYVYTWTHIDYLLGDLSEEIAIRDGCNSKNGRPWFLSEIHFLAGAKALLGNRRDDAVSFLDKSIELTGAHTFPRQSAVALKARITGG